jgi:hypothetical protein
MKKILMIIAIGILLTSCAKEKVAGCGTCKGAGTVNCDTYGCTYTLPVLFDDGHFSDVNVTEYTWTHTFEGDRICF